MTESHPSYTAFDGSRRLAAGGLAEVAVALRRASDAPDAGADGPLLLFEDATGRPIDLDLRGSEAQIAARFAAGPPEPARRRGRPRLGVTAREVTLLPRHWDWLNTQPGGASAALRRLVETARQAGGEADRRRRARDAAYAFMSAMAGDLAGFEEASRALFAEDRPGLAARMAEWPADVRAHVLRLAYGDEAA
jgi:hypothetical protein